MSLREVSSSEVLSVALSLIRTARTEILATMNLGEELTTPLPEEYFLLLEQKMSEGVHIVREGFGTAEECGAFLSVRPISSPQYQFIHAGDLPYRRMLMIDRQKMLFTRRHQGKTVIYYSEKPEVISVYIEYFSKVRKAMEQTS